jgi:non-specific serine/threonine protein kinase
VAALIAQARTNREIADALIVGERTVETHVENILSKLGLSSRREVVAWAIDQGLLAAPRWLSVGRQPPTSV